MIRPRLSTFAEQVIIDRQSNHLSLINVLEEFVFDTFPTILAKISLVNIIERDETDPEQLTGRLTIEMEGNRIVDQEIGVDFQGKLRVRNVTVFGGVPLAGPGKLTATLMMDDVVLGTCFINVSSRPRIANEPAS